VISRSSRLARLTTTSRLIGPLSRIVSAPLMMLSSVLRCLFVQCVSFRFSPCPVLSDSSPAKKKKNHTLDERFGFLPSLPARLSRARARRGLRRTHLFYFIVRGADALPRRRRTAHAVAQLGPRFVRSHAENGARAPRCLPPWRPFFHVCDCYESSHYGDCKLRGGRSRGRGRARERDRSPLRRRADAVARARRRGAPADADIVPRSRK
jgi:hypothetical protein